MRTRALIRLALTAVALIALAAACQPSFPDVEHSTSTENTFPLLVTVWGYCDLAHGVEVRVDNTDSIPAPVTLQHDTDGDGTADYAAPTVYIAGNSHRTWSSPGAHPDVVTVRLGGVTAPLWTIQPITYPTC